MLYQTRTGELEHKIIGVYAKGMAARDMQATLQAADGLEGSPAPMRMVTDTLWSLVEAWPHRALAAVYPLGYLDAIHLTLRRAGAVATRSMR